MSHMVIYRGADGKPGYHQTDDIHDAVMYVESLRNDKDVDHARIFRLEEVTFEYRPYYRVEINASGGAAAAPAVSAVADTNGHDDVVETTESDDNDDVEEIEEALDDVDADASDDDSSDDDSSEASDDHNDDDDAPTSGARRGLFGR